MESPNRNLWKLSYYGKKTKKNVGLSIIPNFITEKWGYSNFQPFRFLLIIDLFIYLSNCGRPNIMIRFFEFNFQRVFAVWPSCASPHGRATALQAVHCVVLLCTKSKPYCTSYSSNSRIGSKFDSIGAQLARFTTFFTVVFSKVTLVEEFQIIAVQKVSKIFG